METQQSYNPEDVSQFYGKTFVTKSDSRYSIDTEGRFHGRRSIEGARVVAISATKNLDSIYLECLERINNLDNFIQFRDAVKKGEKPVDGLCLLLAIHEEDVKTTQRVGFISGILKEII